MHRRIQIEKSEKIALFATFPILSLGEYEYTNYYRKVIFEYHVDTITEFQRRMDDNFFSGHLSITMVIGVRPLIEFGQNG